MCCGVVLFWKVVVDILFFFSFLLFCEGGSRWWLIVRIVVYCVFVFWCCENNEREWEIECLIFIVMSGDFVNCIFWWYMWYFLELVICYVLIFDLFIFYRCFMNVYIGFLYFKKMYSFCFEIGFLLWNYCVLW